MSEDVRTGVLQQHRANAVTCQNILTAPRGLYRTIARLIPLRCRPRLWRQTIAQETARNARQGRNCSGLSYNIITRLAVRTADKLNWISIRHEPKYDSCVGIPFAILCVMILRRTARSKSPAPHAERSTIANTTASGVGQQCSISHGIRRPTCKNNIYTSGEDFCGVCCGKRVRSERMSESCTPVVT